MVKYRIAFNDGIPEIMVGGRETEREATTQETITALIQMVSDLQDEVSDLKSRLGRLDRYDH